MDRTAVIAGDHMDWITTAGSHQVDAFIKALPEGAELAGFLGLGEDRHGLVDLFLGHVAFVAILNFTRGFTNHGSIHDAD